MTLPDRRQWPGTGAVIGLVAFALVAGWGLPAAAQYTAEDIIQHFAGSQDVVAKAPANATPAAAPARPALKQPCEPGAICLPRADTRGVCIGSKADCARRGAGTGQEPPSGQASGFDLLITFDLGSDDLSDQSRRNLRSFADALDNSALRAAAFEISGHTDARGDDATNMKLSRLRAEAVRNYLVLLGVPGERLTVRAFGESRPRDSDPFASINRRVEARIVPR